MSWRGLNRVARCRWPVTRWPVRRFSREPHRAICPRQHEGGPAGWDPLEQQLQDTACREPIPLSAHVLVVKPADYLLFTTITCAFTFSLGDRARPHQQQVDPESRLRADHTALNLIGELTSILGMLCTNRFTGQYPNGHLLPRHAASHHSPRVSHNFPPQFRKQPTPNRVQTPHLFAERTPTLHYLQNTQGKARVPRYMPNAKWRGLRCYRYCPNPGEPNQRQVLADRLAPK